MNAENTIANEMADWKGPSRIVVRRRRAIAIAGAIVAVVVLLWLIFLRPDGDDGGSASESTTLLDVSAPVAERLDQMAPQALADQVLLVGFDGTDATAPFLDQVRTHQFGGIYVDSRNWTDSVTGTALVSALRAAGREGNRVPPLLATAQEGGGFRALADLPPELTELQIGDAGDVEAAKDWARDAAAALRTAGFDLDLFPVTDVATLSSPLGERAFSDDPATVSDMTVAALRGCRDAGLACAPAHFPGLGAASQDTNRGPATVSLDAASLASRDLAPFEAAFRARAPAVVLSLAFYAAYDPITPGALTSLIATELLRDQLGYDGVAITDDLGAGAVRSSYPVRAAAVTALAAGADLLQIDSAGDVDPARKAILDALSNGELTTDRLEQAAGRVLELKQKLGLLGE